MNKRRKVLIKSLSVGLGVVALSLIIYYAATSHTKWEKEVVGSNVPNLCKEAYRQAVAQNPDYVDYRNCSVKWANGQPSIELSKVKN